MKKVIIVTMASLFLMACNGSDGGSSGSEGGSAGPSIDSGNSDTSGGDSESVSPAVIDNRKPIKTQDLVAPEDFSFNPIESQSLSVNLSGSLPARTHLTIYSSFIEKEEDGFSVDYDSKIVDSPINYGEGTIEFSVAQNQSSIVAEIWSYDGSDPLQRKFEIDGDALIWE